MGRPCERYRYCAERRAGHGGRSQEDLGRLLGVSRVTVNRVLRRLTREGAIRITPRGIVIADPNRLEALANES